VAVRSPYAKPSAEVESAAILPQVTTSEQRTHRLAHEDVGKAVYAAIPPRRVPLAKRLFWRAVLVLLSSARGRAWIAARYGANNGV